MSEDIRAVLPYRAKKRGGWRKVKSIAMTRAAGMGPLPDLLEARESGKAVARVFAAEGLPLALIEDRRHWTPLSAISGLFQRSARAAGDPLFGLHVGLDMMPRDYGPWVQYAMQADTLRAAIARLAKCLVLHQIGGTMQLSQRPGDRVTWEYRHIGIASHTYLHHSDHIVPVMIRFARRYLGPSWLPDAVEVGYADPRDDDARADVTQTPWLFGRRSVGLCMPASALLARRPGCPSPDARPAPITSMDVLVDSMRDSAQTPSAQITATIALRLLDGKTDIDGASRLLGTSRRSLQRTLADEGLSYRALLERIRMVRARALMEESDRPLTQIALDIGYSDAAHFTRAFSRHFGRPPSSIRGHGKASPADDGAGAA